MAQPSLNESYFLGRQAFIIGSIFSTDSCYYTTGTITNDVDINHADFAFTKFDLNGNVLNHTTIHNDSLEYIFFDRSSLTHTLDNSFIAMGTGYPYTIFVKLNEQGDTTFLKIIDDFYLNDSLITIQTCNIVQLDEDSSFTSAVWVQHENTLQSKLVFLNISNEGDLNFYKIYNSPFGGFNDLYPGSFLRLPDKSYLIASELFKWDTPVENSRHHPYFLHIDSAGNFLDHYKESLNDHIYRPKSLLPTPDGGFLYCGEKAVYAQNVTFKKVNYVCKVNNNYQFEWEIEYGDSISGVGIIVGYEKILPIGNDEFVVVGTEKHDTISRGAMLKFNLDGDLAWDSYFNYVDFEDWGNLPRHYIYDVEQTTDGGFVMVGQIQDVVEQQNGNPFQSGWLLKTDSLGCLTSDCQDFINIQDDPELKFSVYPNPAKDCIYIDYTTNATLKIEIYNSLGQLELNTTAIPENGKKLIDISHLTSGFYTVVLDNGKIKSTRKIIVN